MSLPLCRLPSTAAAAAAVDCRLKLLLEYPYPSKIDPKFVLHSQPLFSATKKR